MKRNRKLIDNARRLRRSHTTAESKLWRHLANRQTGGAKFRRQHPIGPYIVDFASLEHGLVVEVDGGHHDLTTMTKADDVRTSWLELNGFTVLRFWNNEVNDNIEGVLHVITTSVTAGGSPSPQSSPSRERTA
jgi:very-short-patch-repair endonuclease